LEYEEIVNTERPNHTRKTHPLLSFYFISQDIHWTEPRNQAKQALMETYAVEVTEPNNSKLGQGKYPALYLPPSTNVMQILTYNDPKNKSGWIKALPKELNTIIDSAPPCTTRNKQSK
jgi:hypothetical protein